MPDRSSARSREAQSILEELESAAQATTAELATALETHPMTVERHCRALQRDGYVRQCTGGVYVLTASETDRTATSLADPAAAHNATTNPAD